MTQTVKLLLTLAISDMPGSPWNNNKKKEMNFSNSLIFRNEKIKVL